MNGLGKGWTLITSVALVAIIASTLISGSVFKNPTYNQAEQFIAVDPTNSNLYIPGKYVCSNFAEDFQANAKKSGFNCGVVTVLFSDLSTHALDCFNTTDRGLIFVEPQTDQLVSLNEGKAYSGLSRTGNSQENGTTIIGFYTDW